MDAKEVKSLYEAYHQVYETVETPEDLTEATLSAKAARAGKDIGKPGKQFAKIAKEAGERYGSKERGEKVAGAVLAKMRAKAAHEEVDLYDVILSHLLDEGYADTEEAATAIMANMSEEWKQSIVEEVLEEGEKPFPYEKVTAQQKKHTAAGRYGNMMKMGLAKRRAKEAEKTGGSQQDAGKGWYHSK